MGKKVPNYVIYEKYLYSSNIVSHVFYKVFNSLLYLYMKTINLIMRNDVLYL